jgi:uncharacterized protein (TIGR00369 family)
MKDDSMNPSEMAAVINAMHKDTFAEYLGIELIEASRDRVTAKVTLGTQHHQPHGIVHGGVYASVIESLASIGANLDALSKGRQCVGLDNHTSFVHAFRGGTLDAVAKPITRASRTQLWEVTLTNGDGTVISTGRVRLLAIDLDAEVGGEKLSLPKLSRD